MTLNERIRAWRDYVGMTVQGLADAVGVSSVAVYAWEKDPEGSGAFSPTHEKLQKVADAFGISMATFWGAVPKRKEKAS